MQSKHTSYTVPATNAQGQSLVIFRGAEGNTVIEKQKVAVDGSGRTYISRYIQLKFDILAANGKGCLKTSVFINPKAESNSDDKLELLKNLGMALESDCVELESANENEQLLGTVTTYALAPGNANFDDMLSEDIPETDDDSFAIEVLTQCQNLIGTKYFCKLVLQKQQGDKHEFTRYEIAPDSLVVAKANK